MSYWRAERPQGEEQPRHVGDAAQAATVRLSHAIDAPFLLEIPRYFVFIALTAWSLAFSGLVKRVALGIFSARTAPVTAL